MSRRGCVWLLLWCITSCSDAGSAVDQHLAACGLRARIDLTASEHNECLGRCILDATCEELTRVSARVGWCMAGCGGDFICDGGETVISSEWVCDDEVDCLDGNDEMVCN